MNPIPGLGTEVAFERLRQGILTGALAQGERLVAQRLATDLGLSRTPVKEALASLEREGLVVRGGNWGYSVRQLSLADARDVFEARLLIEPANAFHAATRASAGQIAAMEAGLREAKGHLERGRIIAFQQASRGIHERIAEANGNALLTRMFRQVNDWVMLLAITSLRALPDRANDILSENTEIVAAIRDRAPEVAAARTRRHIERGHEAMQGALGGIATTATTAPTASMAAFA